MSLDVYLSEVRETTIYSRNIMHQGITHTIRLTSVHTLPDGRVKVTGRPAGSHNLNKMADEAGIYKHLWRPEEIDITKAAQLIEPLREGMALLLSDPERFKKFDPQNKWGDYDGLVDFVREYLAACEENPNASVSVSR